MRSNFIKWELAEVAVVENTALVVAETELLILRVL